MEKAAEALKTNVSRGTRKGESMRLIDADALMERLEEEQRIHVGSDAYLGGLAGAGILIAEAPTVAMGDDHITINWTPDIDRLAREVAYQGLNTFSFLGKSIREWVEIILEQTAQVWISTKERQPDVMGVYLCRLADGTYRILGYYDYIDFDKEPRWLEDYTAEELVEVPNVTHWRSLPEPPEVSE